MPWEDGTQDVVAIETLQPPEWIAEYGAEVGATVPLPVDLVEMGLPDDLKGIVLRNGPCPKLETGPGQLVLTTVNHLNRYVLELSLRASDGRHEILRPTGFHKFFSESESAWVSAEDLQDGEILRGVDGPVTVESVERYPGVHRVYNMTVENEHVYRVSNLGVLVHNNRCGPGNGGGKPGPSTDPNAPSSNPIQGLPRVGSALKTDPYHAFPKIVDNFATNATKTQLRNGVSLFQVEGSLNGVAGRFEWIVDGGNVTHRMFVKGGRLNGIPIKP